MLADAEHLVSELPASDGYRRVQLACWAAHQRLLRGDRLRADHLLDIADADPCGVGCPAGPRAGDPRAGRHARRVVAGGGPAVARRAAPLRRPLPRRHRRRRGAAPRRPPGVGGGHARRRGRHPRRHHGDRRPPAAARHPLVAGGAGGVDRARRPGASTRRPRRSRRRPASVASCAWWRRRRRRGPSSSRCCSSPGRSARRPRRSPTSPPRPRPRRGMVAGYGLACVEAGDVDGAASVASRLAAEPQLLVQAGASWPLTAMCAAEVAVAAGHLPLARALREALERFAGTGLALHSVGYFGAADRVLGKLAVLLGDGDDGVALLEAPSPRSAAAARRAGSGGPSPTCGRPCRPADRRELAFVELLFDTGAGGFQQPVVDVERAGGRALRARAGTGARPGSPSWNAGGDGPAWSRRRQPFDADGVERRAGSVPYAELHCHSNFSFLDGASHPEELATEAARLGLEALALTDHDGFYGVVRFAEAARAVGMPTVFGTEITLTPGLAADAADDAARGGHDDAGRHRPRPRQPRPRPPRRSPPAARRRSRRLRPPGPHAEPRAPGGGEGGAAVHARRRRPQHRRRRVGADRLPQGSGAAGARSPTARRPPGASCSG